MPLDIPREKVMHQTVFLGTDEDVVVEEEIVAKLLYPSNDEDPGAGKCVTSHDYHCLCTIHCDESVVVTEQVVQRLLGIQTTFDES